jgi:hypothetical protein
MLCVVGVGVFGIPLPSAGLAAGDARTGKAMNVGTALVCKLASHLFALLAS